MVEHDSKQTEHEAARAAAQRRVRHLEAAQIRAQAREKARVEAWAQARAGIRGALVITVLVTLIVGVAIGTYGLAPRCATSSDRSTADEGPPGDDNVRSAEITPWPIRVYVSGAVVEPQVVELPPGSLITDAIRGAGGMTEHADQDALNLAAFVADNQHVLVPTRGATTQDAAGEPPMPTRININTATEDELQLLPAIGTTRARDIVAYREAQGPFERVEDLLAVPGIGPATYERVAPHITVAP